MGEGLCDICGRVDIIRTCPLCGRRVCSEHFNKEKGICIQCLRGRRYEMNK
ncbi:MAG: hypothetical protein U9M95_04135 [Candidatus Altiarchaeota archaeon]|nr:hypothetical protein [Candidatus Altiarchaeota archaeon]